MGPRQPLRRAADRWRPRPSSATTSGSTAAATPAARSAPSSAARSGQAGGRGPARRTPTRARSSSWASATPANLPGRPRRTPRAGRANGAIYLVGGTDGTGPQQRALLGDPDHRRRRSRSGSTSTSATCRSPASRAAPPVVIGPDAIIVGGTTDDGRRCSSSIRANIAPQAPFFRLGLRRRDGPGAHDRGRDRPAARLPERGRRGDRRLHHPDPDRLGLRPQGADHGDAVAGSSAERGAGADAGRRRVQSAGEVALAAAQRRRAGPGSPARSQASMPPATLATSVRPARMRNAGRPPRTGRRRGR